MSMLLLIVGVVALVAAGLGAYLVMKKSESAQATPPPVTPTSTSTATPTTSPSPTPTPDLTFAATGPNTYVYAGGESAIFGTAGTLRTYKVAIETGIPVPVDEFAAKVDATLSDPRSWIAGKNVRLQRVSSGSVNFVVKLVTPGTAQKLCLAAGLGIIWHGVPYTSCRAGSNVVINIDRYLHGIPNYGASLEVYQQYAINHEVGHALGHGHEKCPGPGKLAPTMQQQTFGLLGCVANAWPYIDGKRYAGPAGTVVPPDN
jgi:hypothetical protein